MSGMTVMVPEDTYRDIRSTIRAWRDLFANAKKVEVIENQDPMSTVKRKTLYITSEKDFDMMDFISKRGPGFDKLLEKML
jgi:hypothetical protein